MKLPAAGLMCKHSFGSPRAHPCGLCEIIHDFEGQNRAYTGLFSLFDLIAFGVSGELKANVLLSKNVLYSPPSVLREMCDLSTLKLESGSFIEESLRPYYSDVLHSLKTSQGDGYIYALIEHQSRPDKHMAFRLMRYAIAAMQQHLDAGHEHLPLVIPLQFYHGEVSPYPHEMNWLQGFANPIIAKQLYTRFSTCGCDGDI